VPKERSSACQSGGSQEKIGLRSEISADDKTKPDVKKGLEEVAAK
jgi:hypothetical protein